MPDPRSAMQEFRTLDAKRLSKGLTPEEQARYADLRDLVGPEAVAPAPRAGFDVTAAAAKLRESLLPAGLRNRPASLDGAAMTREPEPPRAPVDAFVSLSGADAASLDAALEPLDAAFPEEGAVHGEAMPAAAGGAAPFDPNAPFDPGAAAAEPWNQGGAWDPGAPAYGAADADPNGAAQYDPNAAAHDPAAAAWDPNAPPWDPSQAAPDAGAAVQYDAGAQPYDASAYEQGAAGYAAAEPDPNAPVEYDPNAPAYDPAAAAWDPNAPAWDPSGASPGADVPAECEAGAVPQEAEGQAWESGAAADAGAAGLDPNAPAWDGAAPPDAGDGAGAWDGGAASEPALPPPEGEQAQGPDAWVAASAAEVGAAPAQTWSGVEGDASGAAEGALQQYEGAVAGVAGTVAEGSWPEGADPLAESEPPPHAEPDDGPPPAGWLSEEPPAEPGPPMPLGEYDENGSAPPAAAAGLASIPPPGDVFAGAAGQVGAPAGADVPRGEYDDTARFGGPMPDVTPEDLPQGADGSGFHAARDLSSGELRGWHPEPLQDHDFSLASGGSFEAASAVAAPEWASGSGATASWSPPSPVEAEPPTVRVERRPVARAGPDAPTAPVPRMGARGSAASAFAAKRAAPLAPEAAPPDAGGTGEAAPSPAADLPLAPEAAVPGPPEAAQGELEELGPVTPDDGSQGLDPAAGTAVAGAQELPTIDGEDILEEIPTGAEGAGLAAAAAPPESLVSGVNRVVVHMMEGQVKRGVIEDAVLEGASLSLAPQPGSPPESLATGKVKAIFFMLEQGEPAPEPAGQRLHVAFNDGRLIEGFSSDYREGGAGFFMLPADARSNTRRIWIYRAAVRKVTVG